MAYLLGYALTYLGGIPFLLSVTWFFLSSFKINQSDKAFDLVKEYENTYQMPFKLLIDMSSNKNETSKDSSGKVLEYKINLNTKIEIRDSSNNNIILNEIFVGSSSYKVQNQYSETLKLENTSTENLINQAYQDLLIKFAQNIDLQ